VASTLPYSTRFLAWSSSSLVPPYTVPTGYLAIVRDIDVNSPGGDIINWAVSISGIAKFAGGQFTVAALSQFQQWRGRVVVPAGELIIAGSDGLTDGVVCGYLLVDLSSP
jgi:hypothetical protein